MKKTLALLLALLMLAGIVPAFASGSEAPVVVTVFTSSMDLEKWHMTRVFEEQFNIDFQFMYYPVETAAEKFNLLAQIGELPDLIFEPLKLTGTLSEYYKLCNEDVFRSLDDAIEKWGLNISKRYDENPDIKADCTFPDGKMYAFNQAMLGRASMMPSVRTYINSKWLENLGLQMPTTPQELYDTLKTFSEQDANGNGDTSDEIPLAFYNTSDYMYSPITTAFIHLTGNELLRILDEQGQVMFAPAQEEYRLTLTYLNKLYTDGLLYPESFTQDNPTLWAINETSPDYSTIGMVIGGNMKFIVCPWESARWKEYENLYFLRDENGETYLSAFTGANSSIRYAVNSGIGEAQLEVVTRLFDYIATPEGSFAASIGVFGENVEQPGAGSKSVYGTDAYYRALTEEEQAARAETYPLSTFANSNHWPSWRDVVNQAMTMAEGDDPREDWQWYHEGLSTANYTPYALPVDRYWPSRMIYSQENVNELNLLYVDLKAYVDQANVEFIIGKRNLETDWASYLADLQKLSLDRFIELSQIEYDLNR